MSHPSAVTVAVFNRLVGYRLQLPRRRGRQRVRGSRLGQCWCSRLWTELPVVRNRIHRKLQQQITKQCRTECRQTAHQMQYIYGKHYNMLAYFFLPWHVKVKAKVNVDL